MTKEKWNMVGNNHNDVRLRYCVKEYLGVGNDE